VILGSASHSAELSPAAAIDEAAARTLADTVVKELIAGRYPQLRAHMEQAFQSTVTADGVSKTLAPMFLAFGKPLEARFSRVSAGQKTYLGGDRKPMQRFWYDVRTTKAQMGKYFLWIDIVPEQDHLACTYLSIVTRVTGPGIPP
jgi:hypothetical protein